MQNKKITWVEERRYVNAEPRSASVKFIDVDLAVGDIHVTGVARYGKYIVVRYTRRNVVTYAFYVPHEVINKDELADAELLRNLVALNYENEVMKKRINELREFADKLEEQLRDLPVEITATVASSRSHGHVEVRLARQVDKDAFQRYVSICKSLDMKFDHTSRVWVYIPQWSQYVIVSVGY
jgi:cell division protein FtsB